MAEKKRKFTAGKQTKSIVKRLNSTLTRRRFFRALVIDIALVAIIIVMWCGITESFYGGRASFNSTRYFTNIFEPLFDNIASMFDGNFHVSYDITVTRLDEFGDASEVTTTTYHSETRLPFSGVYYVFTVDTPQDVTDLLLGSAVSDPFESHKVTVRYASNEFTYLSDRRVAVNAASMLTLVSVGFLSVLILQCIYYFILQFSGRGLIRKYLRPLDDMALAAERLSVSNKPTFSAESRRHGDGDIDDEDIAQAIDAIDAVDDSCARVEISEIELSGIETAINNMLRRLEAEKRKQIRFVDDASHELRTPIAVITGYANMLDRWGKNDPAIMEEAISAIKTESEHMKTLIDQLLFLARGEMDRHPLEKAPLDAAEIIEEIYDESLMLDADHEYEISSPSAPVESADIEEGACTERGKFMICADAALIKQAIRILRDNAAKYTTKDGNISFKVYERASASTKNGQGESHVCIEVADNGMGIRPEELSRIFDRFYRGSNVRSSSASGSGLGLSIAKWIVEAHGGSIEAISGYGIGTKMTIVLPKMTEAE